MKRINIINIQRLFICSLLLLVTTASNQAAPRAIFVEEVKNDRSSFYVRVDVDRKDRTYVAGETVHINVVSEKSGYLYLFYLQADNNVVCLFPNKVQQNNKIPGKKTITIPAASSGFRLRVGEPVGTEILKAVVTSSPLKSLNLKSLQKKHFTSIDEEEAKAIYVESTKFKQQDWAEHEVVIHTVKTKVVRKKYPKKHQRIAILIGISEYEDPSIPELRVCHLDCQRMAETLKKHSGFDKIFLLVNQKATLKNIENLIRVQTVKLTSPGDEVLIFWSGHGESVADVDGDEKDGRDELLIPYDAKRDDLKGTCVTDDMFGKWLLTLDGRKIVVLLDACKSGGQANNEKGLNIRLKNKAQGFDFLSGEFTRTKDIGQKQTVVLASSRASQLSLVRIEGDLSVLTYFLIKKIESSNGELTLQQAYQHLSKAVPGYVKQKFPGYTQTPVLIGNEKLSFSFKK